MSTSGHWGWAIGVLLACAAAAAPAASAAPAAQGVEVYVDVTGSDTQPGTRQQPVHSLAKARELLRTQRKPGEPGTVHVRAGTYRLGETLALSAADSGEAAAPVVWQAEPGATVRLNGSRNVPADALRPVTDPAITARLDPNARGKVLSADLAALGITNLPAYPTTFRGAPAVPELFYNDQRMTVARWPNQGWATVAGIVEAGSDRSARGTDRKGGVFSYSGDRPARWNVDAGVWLLGYWCFDWYEETIRIKSIDAATRQVTLAEPAEYTVRAGNPSPRRFCALNVLEELDQPGEYYLDHAAHRLYFWPPTAPKGARVELSTLNAPLIALNGCSHVTLRGLTVEAGLATGINVTGGTDVRLEACEVRNLRQRGIEVNDGTLHRVDGCDIHDTGTGGLWLAGGDRKTLTPAGHVANNNHIWGFSRLQLTYASGIQISGVGNRAEHNLLHDAPHMAVGISGNDHIFEFNVIHDVCTETDDCGALYKGRDPSMRGNIVRSNFWHHIGSPMGHGNAAVYFDDGDGGETVVGNIFYHCGEPGRGSFGTVFCHGGHDNTAENNLFIECRRALGDAPWNDQRWHDYVKAELWQTRLLKDVDITKPPYTTHYPALVGFMDPQPGQPRVNRASRNVFTMCGEVASGNWQPTDSWITNDDPGFVNMARGDFRLRPNAPVFAKLPGFVAPAFEKMGLVADALRPKPVREAWNYPAPRPMEPPGSAKAPAMPPRTGVASVWPVPRAAQPPTIDGVLDPAEWPLTDAAATLRLALNVDGRTAARASRAWLRYDSERLYVAVDNPIASTTKLGGNAWGQDEAIEVAARGVPAGTRPIVVVRGFANGNLAFGTTPHGGQEPKTMDPGGIVYRAKQPEPGRWTAELSIPFAMLDVDPATTRRLAFNLTVRKAVGDEWLMWQAIGANSYDVERAFVIELR